MIRFLLRALALLTLAAAFAIAVIDGTRSIAAGRVALTSFGALCAQVFPNKFAQLEAAAQARLPHWAWTPVTTDILALPSFALLILLGLILLRLGRPPRPAIGYSSRG